MKALHWVQQHRRHPLWQSCRLIQLALRSISSSAVSKTPGGTSFFLHKGLHVACGRFEVPSYLLLSGSLFSCYVCSRVTLWKVSHLNVKDWYPYQLPSPLQPPQSAVFQSCPSFLPVLGIQIQTAGTSFCYLSTSQVSPCRSRTSRTAPRSLYCGWLHTLSYRLPFSVGSKPGCCAKLCGTARTTLRTLAPPSSSTPFAPLQKDIFSAVSHAWGYSWRRASMGGSSSGGSREGSTSFFLRLTWQQVKNRR